MGVLARGLAVRHGGVPRRLLLRVEIELCLDLREHVLDLEAAAAVAGMAMTAGTARLREGRVRAQGKQGGRHDAGPTGNTGIHILFPFKLTIVAANALGAGAHPDA